MNANIGESQVIINNQITVQQSINEKINVKEKIYSIIKRMIDIVGGLFGVLLLIPITIGIYIARKVLKEVEAPIFYVQLRVGKSGRQFKIYKYRSMVLNADEKLEKYLEENEDARKEYDKYKKLKKDPRITKLGEFLRKTSLDEFPQFINVLKGDMSLVGPRPYLHREIEDMGNNYNKIITVKPGITGYWQVNGRSDKNFAERTQMDVEYIRDRNLWFDIKIIIKTVLKIVGKEGAL